MILKKGLFMLVAGGIALTRIGWGDSSQARGATAADETCDPALTRLFTPERPSLGRYEACADPRPLSEIAPGDWMVESLEPGDVFDGTGAYDRASLVRLYGGRRARVARGWTESPDRFEATTLVSPYPAVTLNSLEQGTLIIRWICDHGGAECKMLNAGR